MILQNEDNKIPNECQFDSKKVKLFEITNCFWFESFLMAFETEENALMKVLMTR